MSQAVDQFDEEHDKKLSSGKSKSKDLSHVPCKFFKVGACTAGQACPFSHAVNEPGQQKQPCTWFVKGSCKFGHKCALAHILPGQPMSMDRKNKKAAQIQAQTQAGTSPEKNPSGSKHVSSTKDKESIREKEKERKDRHHNHRDSHGNGSTKENMSSSASSLRPPISIGKGTISASVTAPPVLRDGISDELDIHHHSPTTTSKPTISAMEDASSLLRGQSYAAAASSGLSSSPAMRSSRFDGTSETNAVTSLGSPSSPKENIGQNNPPPTHSPIHHSHLTLPTHVSQNSHSAEDDTIAFGSPTRDFGPVGSPPRASDYLRNIPASRTSTASPHSRGTLANLLANLNKSSLPDQTGLGNFSPSTSPRVHQVENHAIESVSSPFNQQGFTAASYSASGFTTRGSNSLFGLPVGTSGPELSSSATSQTNIHALYGNQGGNAYPASFAGSRNVWGDHDDTRRTSLPRGQRPTLVSTGRFDESAVDEEDLEAEEFLPSSLNELLTQQERERRASRTGGARPSIYSHASAGGIPPGSRNAREEEEVGSREWGGHSAAQNQHGFASRSVPAQSLMNNVRLLWGSTGNAASNNVANPSTPSGVSRGFAGSSHPRNIPEESISYGALSSGSYGPSPSLLSTSNMSNASNAFLRSQNHIVSAENGFGRLGGNDGNGYVANGHSLSGGLLGSPTLDSFMPSSYNPTSSTTASQHHLLHSSNRQALFRGVNTTPSIPSDDAAGAYGLHQALSSHLPHHRQSPLNSSLLTSQRHQNGSGLGNNSSAVASTTSGPLSPHTLALRHHEPGQSLPRGLGAGLSRLHLVPATTTTTSRASNGGPPDSSSLSSAVETPPGSGFGVGSPPYASGIIGGNPSHSVAGIVEWNVPKGGAGLSLPPDHAFGEDVMASDGTISHPAGAGTTPTKKSMLSARLAAVAATGSTGHNGTSSHITQFGQSSPRLAAPNVPVHPPVTIGGRSTSVTWTSGGPRSEEDDDVDEGTLFNMD